MAETITFELDEAHRYYNALAAMDGKVDTTTDEHGQVKQTKSKRFTFSRKADYAVIKAMAKLAPAAEDFVKRKDAAIMDATNGTGKLDTAAPDFNEKRKALQKEVDDIAADTVTIDGLLKINVADLKLDENLDLDRSLVAQIDKLLVFPADDETATA